MWSPTDYSIRKFNRKVELDGFKQAVIAVPELVIRKNLGKPVFRILVKQGTVQTITRSDLSQIATKVHSVDSGHMTGTTTEPPFVVVLDSGYLFPTTGLAVTSDIELVEESVTSPTNSDQIVTASLVRHAFVDDIRLGSSILRRDTEYLDTRAVERRTMSPLSPRFLNYYHWMIETVPRVRYIRSYEERTGTDVTLLVPSGAPSWLDETLRLLGWPESKVERATSPVYSVDELLVPSFPELFPQDYRWIRRKVLKNTVPDQPSIEIGNNVYISRTNAIERRVVNEDEVMEMLSQYDFERYQLEESSVLENAHLFNNADVIVGAHGAGLTDLIFCSDSTVIELFGSKVKPPYENLARTLGVEYDSMACNPISTDIEVDTERLEAKIEKVLD